MQQIADWLEKLGMSEYAGRFAENRIDLSVLQELTDQDLKDLGIVLGDRRKLLRAIRELAGERPTITTAIATTATPPQDYAERRQLTVMFCDLVGSTALSTRMDPEDLRNVIGAYHKRVAETVTRFDGYVAKYMGDGVLSYFGYPQAHEDDPERAVRAGLALIDAVLCLNGSQPLQVRIGIGTGLVVVGDLVGSGDSRERGVIGETPNLAARLQSAAAPNTIVIGPRTRRLLANLFEYQSLGPIEVKGFTEPVQAYQVLRPSSLESRFEALRTSTTPLIGRDEELELLVRCWREAKPGTGRVVLISGEPGVGKSRLVEATAERIAREAHVRLRYFCSPHHQDSALHPIIAQMERAAGFAREDAPGAKLAKLQALLSHTASPLEDVKLLADLHALPTAGLASPLNVSPQRKKEMTFEALLRQVEGLARQPLLMAFEDIHWIDPSSRELLDRMIERIAHWPVLLLATFRPEFQHPCNRQTHVAMLALSRLERSDTAAMIANIAGKTALARDVVQEIADRTEGVPLFVEELTKAVLESGPEGGAVLSAVPQSALSVPATLHASLMSRLDRLGAAARDVAQKAAVIGREFAYELLASVADVAEPPLGQALDRLSNAGLLFAMGTPPRSTYLFKHALIQEAAYASLLRSRRKQLHQLIADRLVAQFSDLAEAEPALVARHYTEAGLGEQAIAFWHKAGARAVQHSALEEAVTMFRRALALLADLPPSPDRDALELDIRIAFGSPLVALEGYGSNSAHQLYERALSLSRKLHRPVDPPILRGLGLARLQGCRFDDCDELARALLDDESHDPIARTEGQYLLGVSAFWRGDLARARHYLGGAIEAYDVSHRDEHLALYAQDPKAVCLVRLALVELWAGDAGRADQTARSALKIAVDLDHLMTLGYVITYAAILADESEDLVRLAELLEDADLLWRRFSDRYLMVVLEALRGWLDVCAGSAGGIEKIVRSVARSRTEGETLHLTYTLLLLARARGMVGEFREGRAATREGLSWSHRCNQRYLEAELWRVDGELAYRSGETEAAAASLRSAVETASAQEAGWLELRALHSFASRFSDQTLREQLRDLIETIPSGHDLPAFRAASGLLSESG